MTTQTQITNAIAWYRRHRPAIEVNLLRPWTVGEITFKSLRVLNNLDSRIDLYEQGRLSLDLAESYLLRIIRKFREGLK